MIEVNWDGGAAEVSATIKLSCPVLLILMEALTAVPIKLEILNSAVVTRCRRKLRCVARSHAPMSQLVLEGEGRTGISASDWSSFSTGKLLQTLLSPVLLAALLLFKVRQSFLLD